MCESFGGPVAHGMGEATFDALGVTYTTPDGVARRVDWSELLAVEIATDDGGPLSEDVFWVLRGPGAAVVIPQSAGGSHALLARLQQLPGFDNQAVIAAMSSTRSERSSAGSAVVRPRRVAGWGGPTARGSGSFRTRSGRTERLAAGTVAFPAGAAELANGVRLRPGARDRLNEST